MSQVLRVVLYTNVLVSGIAYPAGTPGKLLAMWRTGRMVVVLSAYILEETVRVLPGLRSPAFSPGDVPHIVNALAELAEIVQPSGQTIP